MLNEFATPDMPDGFLLDGLNGDWGCGMRSRRLRLPMRGRVRLT